MNTARNTMGGTRPRNANDAYYTPDPLALAICRRLREVIAFHRDMPHIIEPSAGGGAFVRAARDVWPGAWIQAIEPLGEGDIEGADVTRRATWEETSARPPPHNALILGNPPFGVAESHVRIALQRLGHFEATEPMPRYLAFLLRASFDGSKKRVALRKEAPPLCKWSITPRPSFTGDGCTDGAEYKVFLWQAGFRGATEDRGDIVWTPEKRKLTPEEREVRRARKRAQQEHRARKALPLATTDDLLAELRRRMESAGGAR